MNQISLKAELNLPGIGIQVIDFHWPESYSGRESVDQNVLVMSLSPMPRASHGKLDGAQGEPSPLGPVLFMPSHINLNARCDGGFQRVVRCCFSDRSFEALTGHGASWTPDELLNSLDLHSMPLRFGLQRIAREVMAPDFGTTGLVESLLGAMALDLTARLSSHQSGKNYQGGFSPHRLQQIEERIEAVDLTLPTVAELASDAGISSRHLLRAYKASTGMTLRTRLQQEARARAMVLLAQTDLPIKDIAMRLGFRSQSSFSAAFRQATGQPPGSYRRHVR